VKKFFGLILFILVIFLWLAPGRVNAQLAADYIEKVEVKISGGGATGSVLRPKQGPDPSTVYTQGNESYVYAGSSNEIGQGQVENYNAIGIRNTDVTLITTVYFDLAKLDAIGGWSDVSGIWVHRACGGSVTGDQYVQGRNLLGAHQYLSIDLLKSNLYKVEFPANSYCKLDLFSQGNPLSVEFELKKFDGSIIEYSFADFTFDLKPKPLANTCDLKIYNSDTGAEVASADNETPLKVVGSGVDAGGKVYRLTKDGTAVKTFGVKCSPGATNCVPSNGPPNFEFELGTLDVDNHTLAVVQDGTNGIICQMSLPIYLEGTTPTPFSDVTGMPDGGKNVTVNIAATIPLCESIPAAADCNGQSCQSKCFACENNQGVWTGIGCLPTDVSGLIKALFTTFTGILGAFIFFCVVSNGIKIMSSRGNPEAMKKGQEAITSCVVGFVVLALSVIFLKIVGVDILQLPGWS